MKEAGCLTKPVVAFEVFLALFLSRCQRLTKGDFPRLDSFLQLFQDHAANSIMSTYLCWSIVKRWVHKISKTQFLSFKSLLCKLEILGVFLDCADPLCWDTCGWRRECEIQMHTLQCRNATKCGIVLCTLPSGILLGKKVCHLNTA